MFYNTSRSLHKYRSQISKRSTRPLLCNGAGEGVCKPTALENGAMVRVVCAFVFTTSGCAPSKTIVKEESIPKRRTVLSAVMLVQWVTLCVSCALMLAV